jgi:hypothetical protein
MVGTSEEAWYGRKPKLRCKTIFGLVAHVPTENINKVIIYWVF